MEVAELFPVMCVLLQRARDECTVMHGEGSLQACSAVSAVAAFELSLDLQHLQDLTLCSAKPSLRSTSSVYEAKAFRFVAPH